jgi:hypothetical protein
MEIEGYLTDIDSWSIGLSMDKGVNEEGDDCNVFTIGLLLISITITW